MTTCAGQSLRRFGAAQRRKQRSKGTRPSLSSRTAMARCAGAHTFARGQLSYRRWLVTTPRRPAASNRKTSFVLAAWASGRVRVRRIKPPRPAAQLQHGLLRDKLVQSAHGEPLRCRPTLCACRRLSLQRRLFACAAGAAQGAQKKACKRPAEPCKTPCTFASRAYEPRRRECRGPAPHASQKTKNPSQRRRNGAWHSQPRRSEAPGAPNATERRGLQAVCSPLQGVCRGCGGGVEDSVE